MGVNYRPPSFSYPVPSSSTLIAPSLQFQPFPFLLVVISPSTPPRRFGGTALSCPYCPAKLTDSRKSWRRPNTLGPLRAFSKVGGDMSHGSHRALLPMLLASMSATGTHMQHGITQCYLPPGRADIPIPVSCGTGVQTSQSTLYISYSESTEILAPDLQNILQQSYNNAKVAVDL